MKKKQMYIIGIAAVFFLTIIALCYQFGVVDYLTFDNLKAQSSYLKQIVDGHYILSVIAFIVLYGFALGASLPVGGPLALIGGYLFGVVGGTIYAVIGSTVGAVCAFLLLRLIIGDAAREHYSKRFAHFAARVKEDGAWYLLMLNLLTIFPFFIINIMAVLARLSVSTVLWTSALGTLPFNAVYSLAGSQLGTISKTSDIWSYNVIAAFVLLAAVALAPLIIKKIWFNKK